MALSRVITRKTKLDTCLYTIENQRWGNLKSNQSEKERHINFEGETIKLTGEFSLVTTKVKMHWNGLFNELKENN